MKKILSLALALLLAAVMMISCGTTTGSSGNSTGGNTSADSTGGTSGSDSSGGSTTETVNLHPDKNIKATIRVAVENYSEEEKIVAEIGEILSETYPNVTVVPEPFSGGISAQYASWHRSKNVPDILINNSFDMFTLSDKGILCDMTPYIEAEAKDEESDFDINDYYASYFKMGQLNFDGAQYMIPRSADRMVCHYNKAVFKEADVDMSLVRNGWTWDDFMTVCETLRTYYDSTDRKKYTLIDANFDWEASFNPIFESYGVEYFDENGEVAIDSTSTENALKFMKSLVDKRYVSKMGVEPAGMQANHGCMLFHSQATSVIAEKLAIYYPDAKKVSDYYDVVSMPVMPGHEKIGCGAAGYSVYEESPNKDLCWQFMKILLSKAGQNIMADCSNYVPVRKDMADYTNPENHWGKGYEDLNLSAYTYNCGIGDDPDWSCYTTYIARKAPKYATSITTALKTLISNYINGKEYAKAVKDCTNSIKAVLKR